MTSYLPYLLISLLAPLATAECPDPSVIVYSPFKPWFAIDYGPEGGDCWSAAICTLGQADAARNQQFATTFVAAIRPMAKPVSSKLKISSSFIPHCFRTSSSCLNHVFMTRGSSDFARE
jgi:hypothetical protein